MKEEGLNVEERPDVDAGLVLGGGASCWLVDLRSQIKGEEEAEDSSTVEYSGDS